MNKLLYFLLFFASLGANAQVRPKVYAPNSTTKNMIINRGGFRSDSTMGVPNRDTTYVPERSGDMVFRPADGLFYIYINGQWYPFQNFVKNIYVTNDLTALNDSTIGLGGRQSKNDTLSGRGTFGLLFDSLTAFTIRGPTLTTAPATSALLQTISTTKGVIFSKMTTTQMNAIISPASGTMIYNTDTSAYFQYNGIGWLKMGGQGATTPIVNIYNTDGTLTGARTMTGNGLSLSMNNMDLFLNDNNGFSYLFFSPAAQLLIMQVAAAGGAPSADIQISDGGLRLEAENGIIIGQSINAPTSNPFALKQRADQGNGGSNLYWPSFTGSANNTDTIATLRDIRNSFPGIDDVLAKNQLLTTSRVINGNGFSFLVQSDVPNGPTGYTMNINNSSTGIGLFVTANQLGIEIGVPNNGNGLFITGGDNGTGIDVEMQNSIAGIFRAVTTSVTSPSVYASTTEGLTFFGLKESTIDSTTVLPVVEFMRGVANPIGAHNGIGGSIDMFLQDNSNSRSLASREITRMTDVTVGTRTAQWELDVVNSGTINSVLKINGNGKVNFTQVANFGNFANNAAALSGGLVAGDVYRNGDVLMVVH